MPLPVISRKTPRPPLLFLYGTSGIGKTTLAASFPGGLILPVEQGADTMDAPRLPAPATWGEAMDLIDRVIAEPTGVHALTIDSVTALQRLCVAETCALNGGARSIELIGGGWGKGWRFALDLWLTLLARLESLRSVGVGVLLIGHVEIKRYDDPRSEGYDRFQPRLQKEILAATIEQSDALLFANYAVFTDKEGNRNRAVGGGVRTLYCNEQPTHLAKNRYSLPDELPMEWPGIFAGIAAAFRPAAAQVSP